MEFLVIQTLNGLSYGLLLFLLSAGLTLIFSMMGVLNFAHASFYMVGAYFGYQFTKWAGFWPALAIAPLAVGVIGILVERYGLRQVHKHGHVAELLFTFGLAYIIEEAVHLVWGRAAVEYGGPAFVTDPGMAAAIGPIVFVIVVVGGMGSLAGAFLASLLIGLLQTFSVSLNWSLGALLKPLGVAASDGTFLGEVLNLTLAQAAPMLPYLIMVLMLIVRPRGLMGTRET
jgi:branched-subunit amino acid ABC-type transport system permease component